MEALWNGIGLGWVGLPWLRGEKRGWGKGRGREEVLKFFRYYYLLSYNTYRNLFEMIKNRAPFNLCLLEIPESGEYLNDLIISNLTNNETCRLYP